MKTVSRILASILIVAFGTQALAYDPQVDGKKHPRRKEVINRAQNEKGKNNAAAANGQITQQQANKLNRQDNRIERQEQRQAARNGGTITKAEQRRDNREENRVNRERNQMEKQDAANGKTSGN